MYMHIHDTHIYIHLYTHICILYLYFSLDKGLTILNVDNCKRHTNILNAHK